MPDKAVWPDGHGTRGTRAAKQRRRCTLPLLPTDVFEAGLTEMRCRRYEKRSKVQLLEPRTHQ